MIQYWPFVIESTKQPTVHNERKVNLSDTFVLTIGTSGVAHAALASDELVRDEVISPVFAPVTGRDPEDAEFFSTTFDPHLTQLVQHSDRWDFHRSAERSWFTGPPARKSKMRK